MTIRVLFLSLILFGAAMPAHSGLVDPVVENNQLSAKIELGGISADLTVRFENAVGLSVDSLGLTAQLVNPLNLSLLKRLPSGGLGLSSLVSVPSTFPVLIRIDPPVDGGLSFEGVVEVEIYTQNLQYTIGSPLRMFTAPNASASFYDITEMTGGGSYRTRTGGGHFSDFLIVIDTRPVADVIDEKFDRLENLLSAYSGDLDPTVHSQLSGLADQALLAWAVGDAGTAITHIDQFRQVARSAAATGQVPNVWRSARDLHNVDGELRAAARTLRFSLTLAVNLL